MASRVTKWVVTLFLSALTPVLIGCEAPYFADTGEPARLIASSPSTGRMVQLLDQPAVIASKQEFDPLFGSPHWLKTEVEEAGVNWRHEALLLVVHSEGSYPVETTIETELRGSTLIVEVEGLSPGPLDAVSSYWWVFAIAKSQVDEIEIHRQPSFPEGARLPVVSLSLDR